MIRHNRPSIDDEDIHSVIDVLHSKWLASGEKVRAFEQELSRYISGDGYTVAVDSGTSAIHLALLSLGIKKGDEIIVPTYVCTAILNAIYYLGAVPVLADINEYDYNISYESAYKKKSEKTRAIIIPHIYGIPADIEKFKDLGIYVIEDCAQSLGAHYRSKKTGSFGDISVFSFYPSKLLTTAKGGAVYSKNKELINKIYDLVEYDCRPEYKLRFNYHLTDFQAALGLSQLKRLDGFISKRKAIAREYDLIVETKKDAYSIRVPDHKENIYYRYVIMSKQDPEKIIDKFTQAGVSTINPLKKSELLHNYLHIKDVSQYYEAERVSGMTVSVPVYPSLTEEEVSKIKRCIDKIYD